MKFLLDVGISRRLGKLLEQDGHVFRYFPDYYDPTSPDIEIIRVAKQANEVIITHDTDFGTLLAFSKEERPSVILFRIHQANPIYFHQLLKENWHLLAAHLEAGSLVVIDNSSIRIRKLPI